MAPSKRVILDSEDDDSDFEDSTGGEEPTEEEPRHETIISDTGTNTVSTAETDPSFFQRVYNETVAAIHTSAGTTGDSGANAFLESLIPDTLPPTAGISSESVSFIPDTFPPTAGQRVDTQDDEPSLSSLPSPSNLMAQTRKSGRAGTKTQIATDTIDLTTPRKPIDDVWDVPSSFPGAENTGAGEPAISTRSTRGKRNRTTEAAEDPYDFPAATTPAPTRKRTKRGTQTSPLPNDADSSPIALVPTETLDSARRLGRARGKNNNTAGLESSALEAATKLYVAQSGLTASQKQEYIVVDISSQNVPQPTLPTQPHGFAEIHKSSGATVSTIPYTTPSRLGSSRHEMSSTAGPGEVSTEEIPAQETEEQRSSPDVLSEVPVSTSAKRGRKKAATSSSTANPSSAPRAAKKRRVVYASDDDVDELEGAYKEEAAREHQEQAFVPESEPVAVEPALALQEPPAEKKRGRKKRETVTGPAVQPAEPPVEPEEPPSKKRRGRPRKSDMEIPQASEPVIPPTEPEVIDAEEEEPIPVRLVEVSRNSKRGKNTKEAEEEEEAYDPEAEEIKENKQQEKLKVKTEKVAAGPESVVKAKDERPAVKSAAAAIAATTKVQYRVGLSKRSRIAPLLKSLKKP